MCYFFPVETQASSTSQSRWFKEQSLRSTLPFSAIRTGVYILANQPGSMAQMLLPKICKLNCLKYLFAFSFSVSSLVFFSFFSALARLFSTSFKAFESPRSLISASRSSNSTVSRLDSISHITRSKLLEDNKINKHMIKEGIHLKKNERYDTIRYNFI